MSNPSTLEQLAAEAYIFAFPLVYNLEQVQRYVTTGIGANPAAPFNSFSHARTLAGPEDKFVTINNDTVYSFAQLDLSAGPLRLEVPDTAGRYYVMQFISAWTDNFAYVGRRATGSAEQQYWLVPPGWTGTAPDDVSIIHFPTALATINGRWAVANQDELPDVHRLQDAVHLTPVDPEAGDARGLPTPQGGDDDRVLEFWERFRLWSRAYPPAPRDLPALERLAPLGLSGDVPVTELSDTVVAALRVGHGHGAELLQQSLRGGHVEVVNGWQITLHVFDYNLDYFEVGAVDDPRWKIVDPELRTIMRAGSALGGLWGNHAYEAAYLTTYVDDAGEQLVGDQTYTLRLSPPPPNGAFWSLTMYDVPNYFLVANEIDRYSIGDRTPGLAVDDDGGVEIIMSHRPPSNPDANWLPAPPGAFRPMLRVYTPGDAVLDGTYVLPPICRVTATRP